MIKKIYLLGLMLMTFLQASAQNPLILKYFVSDANDKTIRLTTQGDYAYTFVKSNNSAVTGSGAGLTGTTEIAVPQIGTYNVSITPTGTFRFGSGQYSYNDPDKDKISEISQWGNVTWNPDLSFMFRDYTNLQITATDFPNFSNVTNMRYLFAGCTNFSIANGINSWNVSAVTDMSYLFYGCPAFNKNIGNWNVSNVTNMSNMFGGATLFNQDISGWNVGNVTDMSYMFSGAYAFNQNIGAWNVGNVSNMSGMFQNGNYTNGAPTGFNQNISNWNTSSVSDFSAMFGGNPAFNQDISNWDVSNALNMSGMFQYAQAFNQNLANWQLSPVATLTQIFDNNGMDCNNFGATLHGWAENPNTPLGRLFGVQGRTYGPGGQQAMNALIDNKGWTFSGGTTFVPDCNETYLGIENVTTGKSQLTLYPNPATEIVFIKAEQKTKNVQVFDASGKMVITTAQRSEINVQQLTAGVYLVKVTLADGSQSTHRLIKK